MLHNESGAYKKCYCSNIRIINKFDQTEMEQKGKYNKKAGFCSFLFPHRGSNKVGVAISRSQSAKEYDSKNEIAILKRPLSLSIKHRKMNGQLSLPGVSE